MKQKYLYLYNNLINYTRNKDLYKDLNREDNFSDRLTLFLLHFSFFLKNYKNDENKTVLQEIYDFNFQAFDNTSDLVKDADILITTTPSKNPLIKFASLPKGIHITAMGSDAEEKNELDPEIIKNCDIYVPDNQAQTTILGELNHAIKKNLITKETLFYDLGKIILNPELGRKSNNDITVADLTGTGVQDTAIARYTYSIAKNKNLGMNIE